MGTELQKRKDALEVERDKIITLAREVISFSEEVTSLDGEIISLNGEPYSVEMISHIIDKWKSINAEPIKWIDTKKIKIDEGTEKINSKNAEIYKRLEEMIEKYRQEEAEIIELEQKENQPEYIKDLVDAGVLFKDGKTVVKTLEYVASFLRDKKYKYLEVSEKFFRETFCKPNGKKYGVQTIKDAVKTYNMR